MADEADTTTVENAPENSGDVVTMVDVLQEEQELEEDAEAVLGGSDAKNCTYSAGYLKRQALYACMTCIPEAKTDASRRAGVCLACSYACHEGHELIELYTKRDFRCDCGNGKFGERKCNLEPDKADANEANRYNHNFSGLYCECERPYPDPEDDVVDDMIQCVVCEDWYHCRHLRSAVPEMGAYSEMTCASCVSKNEFLSRYVGLTVSNRPIKEEVASVEQQAEVEVEVEVEAAAAAAMATATAVEQDAGRCVKPAAVEGTAGDMFWTEDWRKRLCRCDECEREYSSNRVQFLTDPQDTVHDYEERGKAKAECDSSKSQYEQGIEALGRMDRVKTTEAIMQYNDMMLHLKDYLQKFADNKKIVREEDIREFFNGMSARKRQKVDMPYFCR